VKTRRVAFSPEAQDDLEGLYDFIAGAANPMVAIGYIERLERYCAGMAHGSERGHRCDDVRPGLRIVGSERRVAIAFTVSADAVTILRLMYAGRDWKMELVAVLTDAARRVTAFVRRLSPEPPTDRFRGAFYPDQSVASATYGKKNGGWLRDAPPARLISLPKSWTARVRSGSNTSNFPPEMGPPAVDALPVGDGPVKRRRSAASAERPGAPRA
jgi:toxin ParE1/3/4